VRRKLVLVGRPNVGKSTLFNRLTRSRDALVANIPGLTRDRNYGLCRLGDTDCLVVDTGGFEPMVKDGVMYAMARQAEEALAEADAVVFILDARQGITSQDREISRRLRLGKWPVTLAVNKSEGLNKDIAVAEFYELGFGDPLPVSAAHGDGVGNLLDSACAGFPAYESADGIHDQAETDADVADISECKVAIVGRPNVGKSTLINSLLGEERLIAIDQPGTTRDSIEVPFERNGNRYTLVDTAGMRKRGKVSDSIEKFSVIKSLQAIEASNVAILVLDARQDVAEQDAHIADFIVQSGRALVLAINKWDKLPADTRDKIKTDLTRKLQFLGFAQKHYISARSKQGLSALFRSVDQAWSAAMRRLPTPQLTRVLQEAIIRQSPPRHGAFRPKPRYAHQGGHNPPLIVIHGNAMEHMSESYKRYLQNTFQETFRLRGTPLKLQFNSSQNPYVNKA